MGNNPLPDAVDTMVNFCRQERPTRGVPTRTLFGRTGDAGGSTGYHQATVRTLLHNREAKLSACAYISYVWSRFPCLRKAVLRKAGCQSAVIALADFPAIVLADVAAEMKSQHGAYVILR